MCKNYADLNKKKCHLKKKNEFNPVSSNFPGNGKKPAKLFLNYSFNIVLLLDVILNDIT